MARKVKKGVILAGGMGTRLYPATKLVNKHLLPVYDRVMIQYPLFALKRAGIKDVLIITGSEHCGDFMRFLGSGADWAMNFTFKIQDQADGIAGALRLAKDFVGKNNFVVILGDNVYAHGLDDEISRYNELIGYDNNKAMVVCKKVDNPWEYGVAEFKGDDISKPVKKIVEKPKEPKSDMAVTGCYMYPPTVFEIVKNLEPSKRGELEITDVNNAFIKEGNLEAALYSGFWGDTGTHEGILRVARELQQMRQNDEKGII